MVPWSLASKPPSRGGASGSVQPKCGYLAFASLTGAGGCVGSSPGGGISTGGSSRGGGSSTGIGSGCGCTGSRICRRMLSSYQGSRSRAAGSGFQPTIIRTHFRGLFRMVADQREVPLELDNAGQLAALMKGAADRFGCGLVDGEHDFSLNLAGRAGQGLIPGLDALGRPAGSASGASGAVERSIPATEWSDSRLPTMNPRISLSTRDGLRLGLSRSGPRPCATTSGTTYLTRLSGGVQPDPDSGSLPHRRAEPRTAGTTSGPRKRPP